MNNHPLTIRELIDQQAELRPSQLFLINPETGSQVAFGDLQRQVRRLGARFLELGLKPGDKVAFLMDNGLATVELFLGTMYAGLVSVPLNVRAGAAALSYTLEHCDAAVVFVDEAYQGLLTEVLTAVKRPVQVVTVPAAGWAKSADTPLPALPPPAPTDLALLMYSSGSTGQPKAAMHTHQTLLVHGQNSIQAHQLTAADCSLLVLPLYHINAECVTLMPTLLTGGTVVVPHHFSVSQFWDWLAEHRCTWSAVVPTIISQLLDWQDPKAGQRAAAFQRIRFLRSSSAPLSPALHQEFLDKFKLPLLQAMGSTEGGNIFSNPQPPAPNKLGSPGLAWGFETRIIDRQGLDVAPGEPGEVLIRGPGLMQGYYKDAVGTAAVLDTAGWFHTGDLAYQDQDGYFFVVGRSKELIIKGGMNIAPKQIDEVLEAHPTVLEAAAVGVPDRYVGEDVVAFAVLRSGMTGDERALLSFCESRLGHFKTPTRIHFVTDLPKGPSGKIQRLKLQEKAAQLTNAAKNRGESKREPVHPVLPGEAPTPIEQTIATIWADLLKQPTVEIHGNFFSLGGHSLLAIQCLSRLREKLPITLSLSDFFEHATVAEQAALIRERLRSGGPTYATEATVAWEQSLLRQLGAPAADEAIPPRDRSLPCPLSPAQERVWFFEQLVPGVPLYNESEAVRLRGKLNVKALEEALNLIVARHEILRSTIHKVGDQFTVEARESSPLQLKQVDLSGLPTEQRQARVEHLLVAEPRIAYRLAAEPGIRATLIQAGPEEHVFILMMHHLVCDWSSEGVIWRELSAAYRSFTKGEQPALPVLPIQHGDYAAWQVRQSAAGTFAQDLAFWEENLRGAPPFLELPTDRPRPDTNTYAGARQRFQLAAPLVQSLRDCSRREKVSLFTLFTAALDTLLYRYTRQEDILLGIPLADRDRPELQSVIGFLLHTHVLRTQVSDELAFRDLLTQVQKGVLDLYAHRAVPFDQVVSKLQPERNLSYSPLFQVMINWRDRDQQLSFIGMDGLVVESLLAESQTSKFDLTVMLTDDDQVIWVELEYNTDLFDHDRMKQLFTHYQTLLEGIAAEPGRRIADLPLLTPTEQQQILVEWNATAAAYPKDRCLHELVAEQARKTPEAMALVMGARHLTYRELDTRADQMARHLHQLGVRADTLVAICVDRCPEMVVALLAILKAGGAYVPLDPEYPEDRLAYMLEDARPTVLVTQSHWLKSLPAHAAQVVQLDAEWPSSGGSSAISTSGQASAQNLAYVIYTSGSTGKPKGVQIPHQAVVNFLSSMQREPGLGSQDALLAITTLSFDIAGLELWLPLTVGARVVIADRQAARDGRALAKLIEEHHISVMQATPSTWQMLLTSGAGGLTGLKVLCGGEPWAADLARQLLEKCASLWNMYGPTETTIWSAAAKVQSGQPIWIGRPIANTRFYVLDATGHPVPIGTPGELWIGGDGLARGYLNRPEMTAERFVADPFCDQPGARIYKTGDLVRWRASGSIEYLGRLDQQVKIRGFRVELGEIESVLRQQPTVQGALVLARADTPGDKRLVAYVTPKDGFQPKAEELRNALTAKLPDYMVPAAFVTLERFPLTPNGKLDRKALPAIAIHRPELTAAYVPPGSRVERILADLWGRALGLEKVGIHDRFFDLGGHSLLMVKVQTEIRRALGCDLPIADLFRFPTVALLARHLEQPPSTGENRVQKARDRARQQRDSFASRQPDDGRN